MAQTEFDWTRSGIVRTPDVAPGELAPAPVRRRRKRLLLAALDLLALVVGAGALWWRGRSPAAPQTGPASGRTPNSGQPTASP